MGLFKPLNEDNNSNNIETLRKNADTWHKAADRTKENLVHAMKYAPSTANQKHKLHIDTVKNSNKAERAYRQAENKLKESTITFLGLTNEEFHELNEGNCNSDTCKCKGGTCPVEVTDGISTSSAAAKKLVNAGKGNQSDLNAVTPNAEYSRQNDALFIGDGDSPETSKTNIPAILAAKTAGGAPHGWTTDNGINGTGPNVFKLKKLKDDDDGPNG